MAPNAPFRELLRWPCPPYSVASESVTAATAAAGRRGVRTRGEAFSAGGGREGTRPNAAPEAGLDTGPARGVATVPRGGHSLPTCHLLTLPGKAKPSFAVSAHLCGVRVSDTAEVRRPAPRLGTRGGETGGACDAGFCHSDTTQGNALKSRGGRCHRAGRRACGSLAPSCSPSSFLVSSV